MENREIYKERAKILKAMAHPSRLLIIEELSKEKRCVNELAGLIEASMSTVSKHLSVLKSAGIVEDEKKGLQVFYMLRVPCVVDFFSCIESVMKTSAEKQLRLCCSK